MRPAIVGRQQRIERRKRRSRRQSNRSEHRKIHLRLAEHAQFKGVARNRRSRRRLRGGLRQQRALRSADAGRGLRQREQNASRQSAAFSATRFRSRQRNRVSLKLYVEVVFNRERNRVAQGKRQRAAAQQIVKARRIFKTGERDVLRRVGPKDSGRV